MSAWGTRHLVPPLLTSTNGWDIRLTSNNTVNVRVQVPGSDPVNITVEAKGYFDIEVTEGWLNQSYTIVSDQPIQVMQYMQSSTNTEPGDASMMIVPPIRDYHGNTTLQIRQWNDEQHFADILVSEGGIDGIRVAGQNVSSWWCFNVLSDSQRYCYTMSNLGNGSLQFTQSYQSVPFLLRYYGHDDSTGAAMLADIALPQATCPEAVVTGPFGTLTFNRTLQNQTATSLEYCIANDYSNTVPLPRATRTCRGSLALLAVWGDPVLNDCFEEGNPNDALRNIAQTHVTAENVTEYSANLVAATEDSDYITSEGIIAVANALQKIIQVEDPSPEVTYNVISIVDNVLTVGIDDYEETIGVEAPTRILDSLEEQVTLFQTNGSATNLTVIGTNVAVVALQLPLDSLAAGLGFAILPASGDKNNLDDSLSENSTMVFFDTDEIPQEIVDASIIIPSAILDFLPHLAENESIPVSFFIFQTSKLFQSPDQVYNVSRERRLAVGTRVIAATVEGADIVGLPAGQEVETTFLEFRAVEPLLQSEGQHFPESSVTHKVETVDNRSCVFWEKTAGGGRWSTEGCRREDIPDIGRIRCLCDHLTSFAVLLDISGDVNLEALDMLSIIGCVISIICLIITLVTYIAMKQLHTKQPQQILINLCFALLGLLVVFVAGIDRRYPTAGCIVVGFLIHYFLLASVSWMLVEAVNMYLMFVKVFDASVSRFMLKACLAAWGLPLVVCIVTVAIDSSLYMGDNTYCFVKPGPALYYGVLLIIGLLLVINCVIFVIVVQRLSCRQAVAANKSNSGDQSETWRRLQNAVAISVLLGITWIFGFLAIGGARVVFNVLFLVCNSLQGLFVFVMFCVRQKDVRHQWARWLRCQFEEEKSGRVIGVKKTKYRGDDKKSAATHSSAAIYQGIQLSSSGLTETTT